MTSVAAEPATDTRLLADADFRRYYTARVLSTVGSLATYVALPVLVYRLSGSAFLTALVTGFEALPYMLVGLVSGALSDRWDRRTVMVGADLLSALLVGSVPLAYVLDVLTVAQVLVVAFLGPAVHVFFDGANFGALPMLVGRARIASANAVVSGTQTAFDTITPSLAGIALAVMSPAWFLALDAATFVASGALIAGVVRPLQDAGRERAPFSLRGLARDIGQGLSFLWSHVGVRTMTLVGTLHSMANGGFVSLMVVWCVDILHIGDHGWRFGMVFGSFGVGGVVASIALVRVLRRISAAAVCLYALPVSAVTGVFTALAPVWWAACGGLVLWGSAAMMVIVNSVSYRQQVTPDHLLGRVSTAGRMLSWGIGWTVGAGLAGVLAGHLGVAPTMVLMACFTAPAVVLAWTSPLRGRGLAPA